MVRAGPEHVGFFDVVGILRAGQHECRNETSFGMPQNVTAKVYNRASLAVKISCSQDDLGAARIALRDFKGIMTEVVQ